MNVTGRALALAGASAIALLGATRPAPPPAPRTAQHAAYVVEVNRLGQVVRARHADLDTDRVFDEMTYGNVLQAFVRRADGSAVAGVYRIAYDYDPATKTLHRRVALVRAGTVDPNAPGAVTREIARRAR